MADCFLFVYGTLKSGHANPYSEFLRTHAAFAGRGRVRGQIYKVTFYPGLVPGNEGWVAGELYRLTDPDRVLTDLDEYEGSEDFRRERCQVHVDSGEELEAWVYVYLKDIGGLRLIESGEF